MEVKIFLFIFFLVTLLFPSSSWLCIRRFRVSPRPLLELNVCRSHASQNYNIKNSLSNTVSGACFSYFPECRFSLKPVHDFSNVCHYLRFQTALTGYQDLYYALTSHLRRIPYREPARLYSVKDLDRCPGIPLVGRTVDDDDNAVALGGAVEGMGVEGDFTFFRKRPLCVPE